MLDPNEDKMNSWEKVVTKTEQGQEKFLGKVLDARFGCIPGIALSHACHPEQSEGSMQSAGSIGAAG
jgi:hypothetical protein